MNPDKAAQAASVLTQAMSKTTHSIALKYLSRGLASLAAQMEPDQAAQAYAQAASVLTQAMTKTTHLLERADLSEGLASVVTQLNPKKADQTCIEAAAALIQAMTKTVDPNLLRSMAKSLVSLLMKANPDELVELLKHYTCTGQAQRLILDQLENHFGQSFTDHWDFVRYARKRKLTLDFITPPKNEERRSVSEE